MANYLIRTNSRDISISEVSTGKDPDLLIEHHDSVITDANLWDIVDVLYPTRPEGGVSVFKRGDRSEIVE